MALGARATGVLRSVLGRALTLAGIGVVDGVAAALSPPVQHHHAIGCSVNRRHGPPLWPPSSSCSPAPRWRATPAMTAPRIDPVTAF